MSAADDKLARCLYLAFRDKLALPTSRSRDAAATVVGAIHDGSIPPPLLAKLAIEQGAFKPVLRRFKTDLYKLVQS